MDDRYSFLFERLLGVTPPVAAQFAVAHEVRLAAVRRIHHDLFKASRQELRAHASRVAIEGAGAAEMWDSSRGGVIATLHLGSFMLGASALALAWDAKRSFSFFYNPPERNLVSHLMTSVFAELGCDAQPLLNERANIVVAVKRLRAGGFVTMMSDVYELSRAATYVPFFGHYAMVMAGTVYLGLKAGVPIYPSFMTYDGRTETVVVEAPVVVPPHSDLAERVWLGTASLFERFETYLRAHPEGWFYWDTIERRFARRVDEPKALDAAFT